MKSLLFLGLLASAVFAADGSKVNWNHCSRHILNRGSVRDIIVKYDERKQEALAEIDTKGALEARYESMQAALSGEIQATVESELARIYPGQGIKLSDLRREEKTLENGDQVVYWFRGKDLLVRRVILPKQDDQAKPGQLLEVNFSDDVWTARPTLGNILVFGPGRRPLSEIQLARHLSLDRASDWGRSTRFVEGAVPYVSAIYHFEFTARQRVVVDRPSREEERARTVARNRERRFREATRNPQYVRPEVEEGEIDIVNGGGEDFMYLSYGAGDDVLMALPDSHVEYGQSMLSGDRPFSPTRPEPVTIPSQPYVTEKIVFNPPTLYSNENRNLTLMDRVAAHGTYVEGGSVKYEERTNTGALHVQVECNAANYCVETWYEDGKVIRKVNGSGARLVRTDEVDRQRFETRPNEDFPWNPYRIPGMANPSAPRVTPVNLGANVVMDPVAFTYYQPVLGVSAIVIVVNRRP